MPPEIPLALHCPLPAPRRGARLCRARSAAADARAAARSIIYAEAGSAARTIQAKSDAMQNAVDAEKNASAKIHGAARTRMLRACNSKNARGAHALEN